MCRQECAFASIISITLQCVSKADREEAEVVGFDSLMEHCIQVLALHVCYNQAMSTTAAVNLDCCGYFGQLCAACNSLLTKS